MAGFDLNRALSISRHEWRLVRSDSTAVLMLAILPVVAMTFTKPAFRAALVLDGYKANGSEQVVPGFAVLFGFFLSTFVTFDFFREHGWGTWDRLRVSRARSSEILVGKVLPWFLLA